MMKTVQGIDIASRHVGKFHKPPTETPTNHFPDGALMGNGDMTAVLGGRRDLPVFWIGKSDFWTDGEGWGSTNEEYAHYVVSPITIGGVRLWFRDAACGRYEVAQHVADGIVRGVFESQGFQVRMEAFVDAHANRLIIRLENTGEQAIGIHARTFVRTNDDPEHAQLPVDAGRTAEGYDWAARETWDRGRWVSRACLATRIFGAETTLFEHREHASTAAFLLRGGQAVTIVTVLAGGWNRTGHVEQALRALRGMQESGLIAAKQAHTAWWRDYWNRCWVDLGGGAMEAFWYGAYYALACCCRDGATAPGIFGFSTDDHPRWSGDYHLNYNFEHPFQALASGNRVEWLRPYVDAITAYQEEGRRRAAQDLDPPMPGVYYPIGLAPKGQTAQDSYMSQKCAAVYAAWLFDEYFRYSGDRAYAARKLYPYLRDVGRFWEAYLTEENGYYSVVGSASHEHGANNRNAVFDLPLIKRLFKALLHMSAALGVDEAKHSKWRDIVEHLAGYATTEFGGKTVFKESEDAPGYTRSISLFNTMWPGCGEIGLDEKNPLTRIARNTLEALSLWGQGNSFSWVYPAAVRVGFPGTWERFRARLENPESGLRENLTVAQAYGGMETCGAAVAINEMLLQSHEGILRFFPVWPLEQDASFHRMLAVGAVEVSATLRGGIVREILLAPQTDGTVAIDVRHLPDDYQFTDAQGNVTGFREDGIIRLPVRGGEIYRGSAPVNP